MSKLCHVPMRACCDGIERKVRGKFPQTLPMFPSIMSYYEKLSLQFLPKSAYNIDRKTALTYWR